MYLLGLKKQVKDLDEATQIAAEIHNGWTSRLAMAKNAYDTFKTSNVEEREAAEKDIEMLREVVSLVAADHNRAIGRLEQAKAILHHIQGGGLNYRCHRRYNPLSPEALINGRREVPATKAERLAALQAAKAERLLRQ